MLVRKVKLTDEGHLELPLDVLRALSAGTGTEFLLIQEGDHIVLMKSSAVGEAVFDEVDSWAALAEPAFVELWENESDETWNTL